jgi:hypothetical protein
MPNSLYPEFVPRLCHVVSERFRIGESDRPEGDGSMGDISPDSDEFGEFGEFGEHLKSHSGSSLQSLKRVSSSTF